MVKRILMMVLLIVVLLIPGELAAQESANVWETLSEITYRKEFDPLYGFKVDIPVFSPKVKALEGVIIELKGYIIPVEGYKNHKEFVFSAYPYNLCFFCGAAGPETVMEVTCKDAVQYTAEPIVLKGKLKLNTSDINRLMYALVDAQFVRQL